MTFWISAPETFKIPVGDMLPRSAVWRLNLYDLAGSRASGNVKHARMLLLLWRSWVPSGCRRHRGWARLGGDPSLHRTREKIKTGRRRSLPDAF